MSRSKALHPLILLACLALLAGLLSPAPVAAAPLQAGKGALSVVSMYLQPEPACLGDQEDIPVNVLGSKGQPIAGATVTLDGAAVINTNRGGFASIHYKSVEQGEHELTIGASLKGYTSAAPIKVKVKVERCTWVIRLDYNEDIQDPKSMMHFQGSLEFDNQTIIQNEDGSLSLFNGGTISANYHASVYDEIRPFDFVLEPPVDGTTEIQFSGKYDKNTLYITLQAASIQLPGTVNLQMYDRVNPNNKIMPLAYPMVPAADVINKAKINNWKASSYHDFKKFKFSKGAFWPFNLVTYASGVVVVDRQASK